MATTGKSAIELASARSKRPSEHERATTCLIVSARGGRISDGTLGFCRQFLRLRITSALVDEKVCERSVTSTFQQCRDGGTGRRSGLKILFSALQHRRE